MRRHRIVAGVLAWSLGLALPVFAVDRAKSALSMAKNATAAYEAGDHDRATQLYLDAWHSDPTTPAYVYGAARAQHVAGHLDVAEKYYREFLAAVGGHQPSPEDSRRAGQAQKYLEEIASGRIDAMIREADEHAKANRLALAAHLYADAAERRPGEPVLLYRAGRTYFQIGDKELARDYLARFVKLCAESTPERGQAQAYLADLAAKEQTLQKPAIGPQAVPGESLGRSTGWWLTGGGSVLALAGVGLYAWATVDRQSLDKDLGLVNGHVTGKITFDQAHERAASIAGRRNTGYSLLGVGVAVAGYGVWRLISHSERIAVTPGPVPAGMGVAWRF